MVGTICPVGDGTRSVNQRLFDSVCFLVATTLGGLVLGAVFGSLGTWGVSPLTDHPTAAVLLSILATVALLVDFRIVRATISPFPRQVDSILWEIYSRPVVAARWGFEQGLGLLTHVSWVGFYVSILLTILVGLPLGLVIMGTFAAVRGSQPMIMLMLERISARTDRFYDDFSRNYPTFALARTASLASVALVPIALELRSIL